MAELDTHGLLKGEFRICRDPNQAADRKYDLVVVGGGIHGVMVALESARRGLEPLLIERADFGGATSANSHRIIHGGLRYLQGLDFGRAYESVKEQQWFINTWPDFVKPLCCVMPLYNVGVRRSSLFRCGSQVHNLLRRMNKRKALRAEVLDDARVLTKEETVRLFPGVDQLGLRGSGQWFDAIVNNPQRLLIESLRCACALGATALNYVEGLAPVIRNGRLHGLVGRDRISGREHTFNAPVLINCAGPWSGQVAETLDPRNRALVHPSLAFSVLLDREPVSAAAVAVSPRNRGARTYFLVPWGKHLCAGTVHTAWSREPDSAVPTRAQVADMLADVNEAVPDLNTDEQQVLNVYAGVLPAKGPGSPDTLGRPIIVDHGRSGGTRGAYTAVCVKYTTARSLAERVLRVACGAMKPRVGWRELRSLRTDLVTTEIDLNTPAELTSRPRCQVKAVLEDLVKDEAVVYLDDLVLRRTDWSKDTKNLADLGHEICDILEYDEDARHNAVERMTRCVQRPSSLTRVIESAVSGEGLL